MFGCNIAKLRKEKGVSQKHLAELLNVSTSTLGMWEICKREPSYEKLIVIADYFDVSIDYIIRGNGNAPVNHAQLTPEEHELLTLFNQLSSKYKNQTIGLLKAAMLMDKKMYDDNIEK